MKAYKHTPGPWRAADGIIWATVENDAYMIADTAPGNIALSEGDDDNARLIAQAPAMLAELVEAEKLLTGIYQACDLPDQYQDAVSARIDALRDLLTNATGESHH